MKRACSNCQFFAPLTADHPRFDDWLIDEGECRRHPPAVTVTSTCTFPKTTPLDWCGEFSLRESNEVPAEPRTGGLAEVVAKMRRGGRVQGEAA